MGQEQKKYHIVDNGDIFKINEDGSFTELGNAENFQGYQHSPNISNESHVPNGITKTPKTKSNKRFFPFCFILIILLAIIGSFFLYNFRTQQENKKDVEISEPSIARDIQLQGFIESYYHSLLNGSALSYFADNNVTFFDLVNVDKSKIRKRIDNYNKNVSFEFDWSTLVTHELENGEIMYVYSFDYFIHKESRTDKYRITTEMIVTKDRKIKSIRDIQTTKVNN